MMNLLRFWKSKKPEIKFICSMQAVKDTMPIVRSGQIPRPWIKKVARQHGYDDGDGRNRSSSRCPGIIDVMREGFVIRAWCDITIVIDGDNFTWKIPHEINGPAGNNVEVITAHHDFNLFQHLENLPRHSFNHVLKINTPWYIDIPKGYKLLQIPVTYVDQNTFTSFIGMMEYDLGLHSLNIPFVLHKNRGEVTIKAGTPLAQLIPIKMEDRMDMVNLSFPENPEYYKIWNNKMLLEFGTWKRSYAAIRKFWKENYYK